MIRFEFNENKSLLYLEKHGIDFVDAQELWNDANLLEIPAKTTDKQCFLVIGLIKGKHCSGVITYRDKHIRIISVRQSRKEDVSIYES